MIEPPLKERRRTFVQQIKNEDCCAYNFGGAHESRAAVRQTQAGIEGTVAVVAQQAEPLEPIEPRAWQVPSTVTDKTRAHNPAA